MTLWKASDRTSNQHFVLFNGLDGSNMEMMLDEQFPIGPGEPFEAMEYQIAQLLVHLRAIGHAQVTGGSGIELAVTSGGGGFGAAHPTRPSRRPGPAATGRPPPRRPRTRRW